MTALVASGGLVDLDDDEHRAFRAEAWALYEKWLRSPKVVDLREVECETTEPQETVTLSSSSSSS